MQRFPAGKGHFQDAAPPRRLFAIGTNTAGLLVVGPDGRFRSHLHQSVGIHGTSILNLFEDAEGGLWVGLQAGITRVEVNLPLSLLRAGPDDDLSRVYCAGRWFRTLVLGSQLGWYRVVPADPAAAVCAHLERMPGTKPFALACCAVENGMLTLTSSQIMLLDADGHLVPVASGITGPQALCASRVHPGVVYAVDESGRISALRLDETTRQWRDGGIVADLKEKRGRVQPDGIGVGRPVG